MKALVIIRHGLDDEDRNLSPQGIHQILDAIQAIKKFKIHSLSPTLLCSTAPRAQQSGEIIAKELLIPSEQIVFSPSLWRDGEVMGDPNVANRLVKKMFSEDNLLIILTHSISIPEIVQHLMKTSRGYNDFKHAQGFSIINDGKALPFPPKQ